jgi:hypothetical protein
MHTQMPLPARPDLPSVDSSVADDQAGERIEEFPALVEKSARWSELINPGK